MENRAANPADSQYQVYSIFRQILVLRLAEPLKVGVNS